MATSIAARFCKRSLRNAVARSFRRTDCCHLTIRHYARGAWRGLRGVMSADEEQSQWKEDIVRDPRKNPYVDFDNNDPIHRSMTKALQNRVEQKKNLTLSNFSKKNQMYKPILNTDTKINDLPKYEKLVEGDRRFGQMILSAKSRKEREKKNIILLEGYRLIKDAMDSGATAKCIYFSDKDLLDKLTLDEDIPLYKVQYRHLKIWSDTQSPAGIMGIFEKPPMGECPNPLSSPLPLTLVCDNIRDPGNMGSLIRTAAAVGCCKILTTKGCVDVWEPKVIRSGMGSHFHIPILSGIPWEILQNYIPNKSQVLVAEKDKHGSRSSTSSPLSPEEFNQLTEASNDTERLSDKVDFMQERYLSFSQGMDLDVDRSFFNKDHVKQFRHMPLSSVAYDKVTCSEDNVVVIIGGETTGVSMEAKKFAFDNYGQFVTVPMSPVVNSLNSAIAASVILYEVRRLLVSQQ